MNPTPKVNPARESPSNESPEVDGFASGTKRIVDSIFVTASIRSEQRSVNSSSHSGAGDGTLPNDMPDTYTRSDSISKQVTRDSNAVLVNKNFVIGSRMVLSSLPRVYSPQIDVKMKISGGEYPVNNSESDPKSSLEISRARVLDLYKTTMKRLNLCEDLDTAKVWASLTLNIDSLSKDELIKIELGISFASTNPLASRVVLENIMQRYLWCGLPCVESNVRISQTKITNNSSFTC